MRTMTKQKFLLITFLLVLMLPAAAMHAQPQGGGQFWVQAFEDRNGNGTHDGGEPFLTSGVSVDLLNSDGVIMASGTLDDAPFASRGFIGFLYLEPGTYTAAISSPDLTATTPERVEVEVTDSDTPITVLYGAQRGTLTEANAQTAAGGMVLNGELARLALSGFGALVVVGIMVGIGVLVYVLVLRRRAPVDVKRTTTGSMRAVRVDETGEWKQR